MTTNVSFDMPPTVTPEMTTNLVLNTSHKVGLNMTATAGLNTARQYDKKTEHVTPEVFI